MPNSFHFKPWIIVLAIFALAAVPVGFGQSLTSSTLSGTVTNASGQPLPGATVTALHEPTGTKATTVTNAVGRYLLPGLRVGGPYTVTATADHLEANEQKNVQLDLGQTFQLDFTLETPSGEVVKMEQVVVTAKAGTVFDDLITGTRISQRDIQSLPTIARSFNEYARLDPRVVMTDRFSDINNGETSAVGQPGRYNSIQIDGVRTNDVYGLNANGLSIRGNSTSIGNPISPDTIETFDVEISPFDVRQSGFTGFSLNAVTKSGTNELHGSFYTFFTNQNLRAKNEDSSAINTNYGKREPFSEKTYGATLGGPLVKDKLFFFLAYERFERTETPPPSFTPTTAAVTTILKDLYAAYKYDPGTLGGSLDSWDQKILAKLDWNIDSRHRLSLRFNRTDDRQPTAIDYSTAGDSSLVFPPSSNLFLRPSTSFSGHWFVNNQQYTSYLGSLFSQWTPDFQTEAKLSFSRYSSSHDSNSPLFPEVAIYNVPAVGGSNLYGNLFLGTERSNQINQLRVDDSNFTLNGTYLLNNHTLTFGTDVEESRFYNNFLRDAFGYYQGFNFASQMPQPPLPPGVFTPGGFTGKPLAYFDQYALPGASTATNWQYADPALFLQDLWQVNRRLALTGGLRFDYYDSDKPAYNPDVLKYFGIRNDNSIDGVDVFSPRLGFKYDLDSKKNTQLRGGAGVFEGKVPGVLMSNAYSLNGLTSASVSAAPASFKSGINGQPTAPASYQINLMDDHLKPPSAFKGNLALDQKLPWLGLVATLEFDETKTLEGLYYNNLNLKKNATNGTTPDGRNYYGNFATSGPSTGIAPLSPTVNRVNSGFNDVLLLKNTHKGEARNYTFKIQKPWKDHWAASFAYTRGQASEVSPMTSSVAASNVSSRMIYNPNDDTVSRSDYEVRNRFLVTLSREFDLIKNAPTTVSLFYEVRTGRPYSYIFSNDVNGDGSSTPNDLFYVPSGPGDPKVHFANAQQETDFFNYVNGNPDLKKYMGQVVPRNSAYSKSIQQLDLRITQEIPVWKPFKLEAFYDIINLGNLINSHWGRYVQYGYPYDVPVASATYDSVNKRYNYTFTGPPQAQQLDSTLSRWQMQLGLHLKF